MKPAVITIFGSSGAAPDHPAYQSAADLGRRLAKAGFTIANGGYGGTMAAAAQAAGEAGGTVIGVTCSAFRRGGANPYVTREIATDNLYERLKILIELGDAFVILAGSTGTLLEIAAVWELANKGFLPAGKPIILLGGFWKPLVALMESEDPSAAKRLHYADDCSQVEEMLHRAGFLGGR
jgi:uncharacterized protein (TIGR00730 family)